MIKYRNVDEVWSRDLPHTQTGGKGVGSLSWVVLIGDGSTEAGFSRGLKNSCQARLCDLTVGYQNKGQFRRPLELCPTALWLVPQRFISQSKVSRTPRPGLRNGFGAGPSYCCLVSGGGRHSIAYQKCEPKCPLRL